MSQSKIISMAMRKLEICDPAIERSAGADFLGEDVVDGEVVADEEEVAELDLLLPQQALAPRDLPHLEQDLKPAKNDYIMTMVMSRRTCSKTACLASWVR